MPAFFKKLPARIIFDTMLYLIGLGLCDEKDMSIKGVEACKKCDVIYAELYTAKWKGSIENVEKITGRDIVLLERRDVEEGMERIIEEARNKNVALLIAGDPLVATTHINFLYECRKNGIDVEVVHSSSIYTAIAETGLQIYKFGRTVSIPETQDNYFPTSFYDYIETNRRAGLHTLILLDINMDAGRAVEILLRVEKEKQKGLFSRDTKIIACSNLGCKNSRMLYGSMEDIANLKMEAPCILILPGDMHVTEKEYVELIKIK